MAVKNKAMAGGAIGLVLVGAYYFSNLFNGFGLGPGAGPGTGSGKGDNSSETVNSTEEPNNDNTQPISQGEPGGVELGKIVMVLIDGEEYKILKSPDADPVDAANYAPATLEQIVKLAKAAPGVQGRKLQFAMRETSTAQAEADLQNALLAAGLPRHSFHPLPDTVP